MTNPPARPKAIWIIVGLIAATLTGLLVGCYVVFGVVLIEDLIRDPASLDLEDGLRFLGAAVFLPFAILYMGLPGLVMAGLSMIPLALLKLRGFWTYAVCGTVGGALILPVLEFAQSLASDADAVRIDTDFLISAGIGAAGGLAGALVFRRIVWGAASARA